MIPLDEFNRLKRDVDNLKEEEAKAQGAIESLTKSLKEFGCTDVKSAEKKLAEMDKKITKSEKEYTHLLEEFRKKWKNLDRS